MIFELEDDCFLLLRAQELFVFIFSVCLLLVMIRPSCECEKNPVKNRPCLPFRLQIAQLHQTSREPWIFHLASLRVQQPLAHLLLQKPTTFLIKADATYALALGCQWDGPLTVQKITAFWRLEWGHGILPIWRSPEAPLKTLDKSTQKKWDSLERIHLNR